MVEVRWRVVGLVVGAILFLKGLALWQVFPGWDADIAARLRLTAGSPAAEAFSGLTIMGSAAVMIPVALVMAGVLGFARRYRAMRWLVLTVAGGRIAVEATKYLVGRARPPASLHLVNVITPSFPSSHSAGTALTVLAILAVLQCRRLFWGAGFALILLIGLSRIMLGVHWPSDVLAGWGFGIFWVAVCFSEKFISGGDFSSSRPLRNRD